MKAGAKRVCVVGAGLSGLAAVQRLVLAGHEVECFEAGSAIGGMWRHGNDNGVSAAYASLRANVSYKGMQYPGFRERGSMSEFPSHSELLAYLERYAEANDLLGRITCGARVERARPLASGWQVTVDDSPPRDFDALVVATGHYWDPDIPALPGRFGGTIVHVRDYDTPAPFAGRRVVVVGAAQSALDVAAEISTTAARTILAARQGHHLIPRHIFGRPYDALDSSASRLLPLALVRHGLRAEMRLARAIPDPGDLPAPRHPLFESRWPVVVSPAVQRALSERAFECRPAISRLEEDRVEFTDGRQEDVEVVVFATGYRVNFPFLPERLGRGDGMQFPLYRRILSPYADGLAFIGILEPGPGLPGVVARQSEWLGEALANRLAIPRRDRMWRAIDAGGERRSQRQFGSIGPHALLCNRHAYVAMLKRDLRRARIRPRLRHPTVALQGPG
jgi:dimethylaniline monooxygenase (N-oxide forming)